ncbi:MAG: J domain-containing protein [Sulfurimonas sp.]|nr:J domain-containing protein [Sulfurimonas sp.]
MIHIIEHSCSKWIYTLYTKRTKNFIPELKERLVIRQKKAIKIILPQNLVHHLIYTIIDESSVSLEIKPKNYKIVKCIKSYINIPIVHTDSGTILHLQNNRDKKLLKEFMNSASLIDIEHKHVYKKKEFAEFFKEEKDKRTRNIQENPTCPYLTLGLLPSDTLSEIKKRYKYLAKCHHPDMIHTQDEATLIKHTKVFQNILNAYQTILKETKLAS